MTARIALLGALAALATPTSAQDVVGVLVQNGAGAFGVAGQEVTLCPAGVPEGDASCHGTWTDSGGAFVLPSVPPGRYTVRAHGQGTESTRAQDIDVGAGGDTRLRLLLP